MLVLGPIALLCIAAALYLLVFFNAPWLYILALPVALIASTLVSFFTTSEVAWRLIPRISGRPIERHKPRFTAIVVGCLSFIAIGGWLINALVLPHRFHVVSLLGNALIFLYTWIVGWRLLQRRKLTTAGPLTITFGVAMVVLGLLGKITISDDRAETIQELTSLPYVGWSAPDTTMRGTGVTIFDEEHAVRGMNLYANDVAKQAILMDMSGDVLHTWDYGHLVTEQSFPLCVELCENGDLLVSAADRLLVKLDWDSNVLWRVDARVHHDIAIAGNGDVLALARKDELTLCYGIPMPVLNDYIFVFSADGEKKREIPLLELFAGEIPIGAIQGIYRWALTPGAIKGTMERRRTRGFALEQTTPVDLLHTNAIEIIERDIEGVCRKGNVLLSFRDIDLIGILDLEAGELVWSWGRGELSRQHQPTLLDNGNILVFDNGLVHGASRIVELDPVTGKIAWTYEAFPAETFYSKRMGSNQRLPGGSTLVTNSETGHVFEISKEHGVVWEYYNPAIHEDGKSRAIIYRMRRITDPETYAFPEGFAE